MHYPSSIQKLIDLFSKFPTVGPRTAARFVFYLLKLKKEEVEDLIKSIASLGEKIKLCPFCFSPFEPLAGSGQGNELCKICQDKTRDRSLLCVVANAIDLAAIEKTKKYNGLYFILGGLEKLRTKELEERIKNHPELIKEIIIAINPTPEGEAAVLLLERLLKRFNKKIARLGRGLPVGGELEYADEETLGSALDNRK